MCVCVCTCKTGYVRSWPSRNTKRTRTHTSFWWHFAVLGKLTSLQCTEHAHTVSSEWCMNVVQGLTWITWISRRATPASWWECRTASEHWLACSAQLSLKWWPSTKYVIAYDSYDNTQKKANAVFAIEEPNRNDFPKSFILVTLLCTSFIWGTEIDMLVCTSLQCVVKSWGNSDRNLAGAGIGQFPQKMVGFRIFRSRNPVQP